MNTSEIQKRMLDDLARSGLTPEDAKILKLKTGHTLKPSTAGYVIPYFDAKGRQTKFYRVRYLETTLTGFAALSGKKPLRYNQPPATLNEIYLPPYIKWSEYLAGKEPLIITEGEKKSALATREGLPTIGLGGVWCFMSKKAGTSLLPALEGVNYKDRVIYICYDSDAATNPDVLMAEATLAKRLIDKGATVMIARIPQRKGRKVGIDDYITAYNIHKFKRNVLHGNSFEYSASKELHAMNEELVYLRNTGTLYDYIHNMRISPVSFTQHTHSNRWIDMTSVDANGNSKLVRKPAAKLWLEWEHRAELHGMTYDPGQPRITEFGELNTWSGWGVDVAEKGDVSLWHRLLDHLFDNTEAEARRWFERWCAYPIQNPGAKMASAVVMWGVTQGTGKTLCGHTLMRLYGDNATEVKDADLQDTRFSWAENKQFVLADDITGQNNRKLANMFKTMITQKTIHVNPKYIASYTIPDRINYLFTSNDPDAFYLDDGDRRFFIHEVVSDQLPESLRKPYVAWSQSKAGIQHLFHYLLNLDLGDFDPQAAALRTEAKSEMTYIGKSELGAWVHRLKTEPDTLLNGKQRSDLFTSSELHMLYDPLETKRASPNALAREMKRSGIYRVILKKGGQVRIAGRQMRLYAVRNADRWRTATAKDIEEHYTSTRTLRKEKLK